jgi:hypothetical protein
MLGLGWGDVAKDAQKKKKENARERKKQKKEMTAARKKIYKK